ncbi:hypothetical protein CDD81_4681 [Ophiocordyceps australis]|uniref:Uncharacterized protein n=1 Tax=Ophiocordyceps australis TaxID=1399860 RepID=A0A2C5YBI5_9HYPO|nr:hypothetical protein CDD81_4681 [Ophiocordyceps australis]
MQTHALPKTCYIFLDREQYPRPHELQKEGQQVKLEKTAEQATRESLRRRILEPFDAPPILSTDTGTDINGYIGAKNTYDEEDKLYSHNVWFRSLAKIVSMADEIRPGEKEYKWYEMGFYTHWDRSGQRRILCIDTPSHIQEALYATLSHRALYAQDPFAMLEPLIDELVKVSDKSVWRVRNAVRQVERASRPRAGCPPHGQESLLTPMGQSRIKVPPNFERMQEVSRHAIHVRESLTVLMDTLDQLRHEADKVYLELRAELPPRRPEQAQAHLQLQIQMVKSLKERSASAVSRLDSEIHLAYNIIAQKDSAVMKSIAVLTMVFLPATFVSAFFSTTFFTFNEGGWGGMDKIWVYVVATLPSTVVILLIFRTCLGATSPSPPVATPQKPLQDKIAA